MVAGWMAVPSSPLCIGSPPFESPAGRGSSRGCTCAAPLHVPESVGSVPARCPCRLQPPCKSACQLVLWCRRCSTRRPHLVPCVLLPRDNIARTVSSRPTFAALHTPTQGVSFAVFGLGNRQYEHFCAMGSKVSKAMKALGAREVAPRGEGDDDKDIDAGAGHPWQRLVRLRPGVGQRVLRGRRSTSRPAVVPLVSRQP